MAFVPPAQWAKAATTGSATPTTLTIGPVSPDGTGVGGSNPTVGNLYFLALGTHNTSSPAITQPTGWNWIEGASIVNASGQTLARFWKVVASGDPTSMTVNWTNGGRASGFLAEYPITNASIDVIKSLTGSSTAPAISGAATTAQADELEIAVISRQKASTLSALTDSFSLVGTVSSDGTTTNISTCDLLDKEALATNAPAPGGTLSATSVWVMSVDTFSGGAAAVTARSMQVVVGQAVQQAVR